VESTGVNSVTPLCKAWLSLRRLHKTHGNSVNFSGHILDGILFKSYEKFIKNGQYLFDFFRQSMAVTAPLFKKFRSNERHYVKTCYTECYRIWAVNVENTRENLYAPLSKV
jgi:hypothetical protein